MQINTKRLVETFFTMVQIDSESGSEQEFTRYMVHTGKELGTTCRVDRFGNVYLRTSGRGRPLMLNTHMDTVAPGRGIRPSVQGKYIVSDGRTILGADSKAGIAAMIETLLVLKQENIRHRPLLITLSCNEESGIPTADKIVTDVKECVVSDRGTPLGEVIVHAPYAQVYEVTVTGKTAYAPSNFDDGVHAIRAACEMISKLPLGVLDSQTTTNVGIIGGGRMTSMVPETCVFKGNCYTFKKAALERFIDKLHSIIKRVDVDYRTKSALKFLEYFPGFQIAQSDRLVSSVTQAIKKTGIAPCFKRYMAVTNANLLSSIGIKSVLISTGVEYQHTTRERIAVDSLNVLTRIILNLAVG